MELFKAHDQWSRRPDDERFPSIEALETATKSYAATAGEVSTPWREIRTEATDGDVKVVGQENVPARLTHWAFGQLANRVGAPAEYLRNLPAELAVENLNHGLQVKPLPRGDNDPQAQLLFHQNGGLLCRAVTSDRYARIWNYEVAERLRGLEAIGWEPAVPDFNGDPAKLTALYASDHDLFAFLRNPNLAIEVDTTAAQRERPVYRGVIVENSEVGAGALKLTRFLYNSMCGNHIIWGASNVVDLSLRHVGRVRDRMYTWDAEIHRYANESASEDAAKISSARTVRIADTKDGVLDKLFGLRSLQLSRKVLDSGFEAVKIDQDGDPRTVWGMVQGITRHSQTVPYADKRTDLDRAAGRLLSIRF